MLLQKKTLKREKGVEPATIGEEAYRSENAKYSVLFQLEQSLAFPSSFQCFHEPCISRRSRTILPWSEGLCN